MHREVVLKDQTGSNTGSMMCIHTVKEQSQMSLMSTLYQQHLLFRTATGQMEGMQTHTLRRPAEWCEEQDNYAFDFLGQCVKTSTRHILPHDTRNASRRAVHLDFLKQSLHTINQMVSYTNCRTAGHLYNSHANRRASPPPNPPRSFWRGASIQQPRRQAMPAERQTHLDFFGTLWSAADIAVRHWDEVWEAVTARLIHQIPCKDGGVVLVQPVVDGVAPVDHCMNVVLEQLLHIWVCEEWVVTLSARPLYILHHTSLLVLILAG